MMVSVTATALIAVGAFLLLFIPLLGVTIVLHLRSRSRSSRRRSPSTPAKRDPIADILNHDACNLVQLNGSQNSRQWKRTLSSRLLSRKGSRNTLHKRSLSSTPHNTPSPSIPMKARRRFKQVARNAFSEHPNSSTISWVTVANSEADCLQKATQQEKAMENYRAYSIEPPTKSIFDPSTRRDSNLTYVSGATCQDNVREQAEPGTSPSRDLSHVPSCLRPGPRTEREQHFSTPEHGSPSPLVPIHSRGASEGSPWVSMSLNSQPVSINSLDTLSPGPAELRQPPRSKYHKHFRYQSERQLPSGTHPLATVTSRPSPEDAERIPSWLNEIEMEPITPLNSSKMTEELSESFAISQKLLRMTSDNDQVMRDVSSIAPPALIAQSQDHDVKDDAVSSVGGEWDDASVSEASGIKKPARAQPSPDRPSPLSMANSFIATPISEETELDLGRVTPTSVALVPQPLQIRTSKGQLSSPCARVADRSSLRKHVLSPRGSRRRHHTEPPQTKPPVDENKRIFESVLELRRMNSEVSRLGDDTPRKWYLNMSSSPA